MHSFLYLLAIGAITTTGVLSEARSDTEERATSCSTANPNDVAAAKAAFTSAELVPDLIPSFDPDTTVQASYNGKQIDLGNTFSVTETLLQPSISFLAEPNYDASTTNYTIFLVDPDAPGPALPVLSDFLHLIIENAQPSCITTQSPIDLAPYMSLTPLSVAPHRYTILVYRQPPNYVAPVDPQYVPGVRNNFDLNGYVAEAGLEGPIAGNFFREGLSSTDCAITPNCTQDGTGYPTS
ncbi:PEBP-like protein [Viridothelium virens]|uniref:PEBP-like protein n=1 Tax=Viridothelium virens TaxID=1048519 RepID=A0A6A6H4Y0_VIRVR|nr:PEBP-like protein [Viridothelium virens]